MMQNWKAEDAQHEAMARDLGLDPGRPPVPSILEYCESKIRAFVSEMDECNSLSDMLDWVANKVSTTFRILRTDDDLHSVRREFIARGEKCFANIEADLAGEVYGITYRLQNRDVRSPQFISIIDCRGEKAPRSYFTKWHEIAHLLTLTRRTRMVFRRTHSSVVGLDPEEQLMDVIAGKFGFYSGVAHKFIDREISFKEVERLRVCLCPEASQQSALINFVKYWPSPCILLRAEMSWTKNQQEVIRHHWSDDSVLPEQALRLVRATPNVQARQLGFKIFEGMRVPDNSAISRVFAEGMPYAQGYEDLSCWSGRPAYPVKVKARLSSNGVEALIIPVSGVLTSLRF